MPIDLYMVRRGDVLVPAWPQDEEEIHFVPAHKTLTVSISRSTPAKLPAWYRALISRIHDARPGVWPSAQEAHKAMLLRAGYFEDVHVSDFGDVTLRAPSTRKWDEIQWRTYIEALWPIVVTEVLPEIGERRLRDGIKALIGLELEEALKAS